MRVLVRMRNRALAVVGAVALAIGLAGSPVHATTPTMKWQTFGGECNGLAADVMPVVGNGPFVPYFLNDNRTLVPYFIIYHFFGGDDIGLLLKTRHGITNGEPLVKPGPMPANLTICELVGEITQDGHTWEFTATVEGVVRQPQSVHARG